MVTKRVLLRAISIAHEYYKCEFYGKFTRITQQDAELAANTLKEFIDGGQQLYDKTFWGLGPDDSICAVVGPLKSNWDMIECYKHNIAQRKILEQQLSAEQP